MSTTEHHRLGFVALLKHAGPNILISTVVPTLLFYMGWFTEGRNAAFALAAGWALTLLAWRAVRRQRIPAMLILTSVLLGVRIALAVSTGSTKLYFVQPIVTTVVVGAMFIATLAAGQPLIHRLAGDLCPLPAEVAESAEMRAHFRRLSFLWAGIYFVNAAVTLLLLLNLPVSAFMAAHSFTGLAITWTGIAFTAHWSRPVLRRFGLIAAKA